MHPATQTELMKKPSELPAGTSDIAASPATRVSAIVNKAPPEAEAELRIEFDRVLHLSERDPLGALDEALGLMLGVNTELLKALSPPLIEAAQMRATEFQASGTYKDLSRGETRSLASMLKTQEASLKLLAARAKVRDEMRRRTQ